MTQKTNLTFFFFLLLLIPSLSFAQYCMPSANCMEGDAILYFEVNTFSHNSDCDTGSGVSGYSDVTNLTGLELQQGIPYQAILTCDYQSQFVSAWIDMDNNQVFETAELVLIDLPAGIEPVTTEFTVPSTLPTGNYVMRLQTSYNTPTSDDACSLGTYGETKDYTLTVLQGPDCFPVGGLNEIGESSSQSTIDWTNNGDETVWDIEYVPMGETPTGIPSTDFDDITKPVTIMDLSPSTAYDIYIRADCGMNNMDVSTWTAPFTIMTAEPQVYCIPPSDCAEGDAILEFTVNTFSNTSSCNADNDVIGYSDFTDLVGLELQQGVIYEVSLTSGFVQQRISAWIDMDDSQTFDTTELVLIDIPAGTEPITTELTIPFELATGDYRFRLQTSYLALSSTDPCEVVSQAGGFGETEDYTLTILTGPDCFAVNSLVEIGESSANPVIDWTSAEGITAWDIEYVLTGELPTGTPNAAYDNTTKPAILTGLNPFTSYDVYVRSDCSGDNTTVATWAGPLTITTACAIATAPYHEPFNTTSFEAMPYCWVEAEGGNLTDGPLELGSSSWTYRLFASYEFYNYYNSYGIVFREDEEVSDWFISPYFDLSGSPSQVDFDFSILRLISNPSAQLEENQEVHFLISDDDGNSWTNLQTWTMGDFVNSYGERITHDLTSYVNSTVRFAFYAKAELDEEAMTRYVSIDNFHVRTPPTCPEVSGIRVYDINEDEATVSWTENGSATLYDIELVLAGETPTGIPTESGVSSPHTITGLYSAEEYQVYIRASCDVINGDYSLFSESQFFQASCTVFSTDYLQDFASNTPDCWGEANAGGLADGPIGSANSNWIFDGFANVGTSGAQRIFISQTHLNAWLIAPPIDLSNAIYAQTEFDIALTEISVAAPSNLGSDDFIHFVVTNDDWETWSVKKTWDTESVISHTGEHIVQDLSDYVGDTIRCAFYVTNGLVDDPEAIGIFVDNFEVLSTTQGILSASTSSTDESCAGDDNGEATAIPSGGLVPYEYLWSNNETNATITGLPSGDYFCTITDAEGNTFTTSVVTINPGIVLSGTVSATGETVLGLNDGTATVELNNGIAPYIFSWSNAATSPTITDLAPGEYCVTVTDDNGCEFVECANITEGTSSIRLIDDLSKISVTPNPVGNEDINLTAIFTTQKHISVSLINSTGQVLATKQYTAQSINATFDMSAYPSSLYFLKLTDMNTQQVLTKRVIKQ